MTEVGLIGGERDESLFIKVQVNLLRERKSTNEQSR